MINAYPTFDDVMKELIIKPLGSDAVKYDIRSLTREVIDRDSDGYKIMVNSVEFWLIAESFALNF